MKKAIAISMILLTALSTFAIFAPQGKAESDYQLTTDPRHDDWPSWSPDGTKIAYYAFAGSWYRHIWVMNNDGTGKTQLTSGSVVDQAPAYSPDGTKIAFQRHGFRGDYFDIMIMGADGSNVQRITNSGIPGKEEGTFGYPRWSEDGTKLIFHYGEGTTGSGSPITAYWICTINVDGTGLEVLGRGEVPRFCHGDTKILFHTDWHEVGKKCIALMNADGTGIRLLTDGPNDLFPHMSPTTNRILFNRNWENLYVMNEDGGNLAPITSDGTNYYCFAEWSPDEKYIVYASDKSGNRDIWKMEAPSVGAISLTVEIDPRTLNLKSNGEWITAYIELPEGYNVTDIDLLTVQLEGILAINDLQYGFVTDPASYLMDHDGDGILERMVKFDRSILRDTLTGMIDYEEGVKFYNLTLTVTGQLTDGTLFEGSDTIVVICRG